MTKIKKLDINMFPDSVSKTNYEKARAKYIAGYTRYVPSTEKWVSTTYKTNYTFGFLPWSEVDKEGHYEGAKGYEESNPVLGEALWNEMYPQGYDSWKGRQMSLNANGEQSVIDKINELVKAINKLNNV